VAFPCGCGLDVGEIQDSNGVAPGEAYQFRDHLANYGCKYRGIVRFDRYGVGVTRGMQISSKDTKIPRNDLPLPPSTLLQPAYSIRKGRTGDPCTLTNNDQMPTGGTRGAAAEADVTTLLGKPSIPTTGGLNMNHRLKRRTEEGLRPSKAEAGWTPGTQTGTGS
jgi:hypothetical protein